jgi:hypothetical protein
MTSMLRRLIVGGAQPIDTYGTDGGWGEMDNPDDAALYHRMIEAGELRLEE